MAILRIWDEASQSYKEIPALVGPKGDKGDTGAQGPAGADGQDGQDGAQGLAGPNEVSASTATNITGLIKGNGSTIAKAVAGEDYAIAAEFTATLGTDWTEDSNDYKSQTVTVSGLLASDNPFVDCVLSGTDPDADTQILAAFSLVNRIVANEGSITAQCIGDAPTVNIPLMIKVVR